MYSKHSKAMQFALEILRRHPQITFQHAVAAASYSGISGLSFEVYDSAQRRLGFATETQPARSIATEMTRSTESTENARTPESALLQKLQGIRDQCKETAEFRAALVDIRIVVREALAVLS